MTYNVKLPQFEGPFDLLLFFIERDELDIYNIPIASLTNDFLAYIKVIEDLDIDQASEFILVASTLMRIKAKMLIPRKQIDEEGNEIDPREELVQRLLEYKQYKGILDELRTLEEQQSGKVSRGNVTKELKKLATRALVDSELESLTLYKLLKAYQIVQERFEDANKKITHTVVTYSYSVDEQKEFILQMVGESRKSDFRNIFKRCKNRMHAIFNFLALLELLQLEEIAIIQGEGVNNFWICPVVEDIETKRS